MRPKVSFAGVIVIAPHSPTLGLPPPVTGKHCMSGQISGAAEPKQGVDGYWLHRQKEFEKKKNYKTSAEMIDDN